MADDPTIDKIEELLLQKVYKILRNTDATTEQVKLAHTIYKDLVKREVAPAEAGAHMPVGSDLPFE